MLGRNVGVENGILGCGGMLGKNGSVRDGRLIADVVVL